MVRIESSGRGCPSGGPSEVIDKVASNLPRRRSPDQAGLVPAPPPMKTETSTRHMSRRKQVQVALLHAACTWDSRMALAISAPLLAQIQTCICVSSSVTCVQKRTVSGQLVRIHCPNSQWSRRPLHAPFFILMAAPRCYTRNIAETAITRIIVSEAIGT